MDENVKDAYSKKDFKRKQKKRERKEKKMMQSKNEKKNKINRERVILSGRQF